MELFILHESYQVSQYNEKMYSNTCKECILRVCPLRSLLKDRQLFDTQELQKPLEIIDVTSSLEELLWNYLQLDVHSLYVLHMRVGWRVDGRRYT